MSVGKYASEERREILKTTLLYHDGKTQVPKKVIKLLLLVPGHSTIVWIKDGDKVYVQPAEVVP